MGSGHLGCHSWGLRPVHRWALALKHRCPPRALRTINSTMRAFLMSLMLTTEPLIPQEMSADSFVPVRAAAGPKAIGQPPSRPPLRRARPRTGGHGPHRPRVLLVLGVEEAHTQSASAHSEQPEASRNVLAAWQPFPPVPLGAPGSPPPLRLSVCPRPWPRPLFGVETEAEGRGTSWRERRAKVPRCLSPSGRKEPRPLPCSAPSSGQRGARGPW